jgi:hypothetical protein
MPVVHVKNTCATTITSLQLSCTVDGGTPFYYTWTGNLPSLQETDISFPVVPDIATVSGTSGSHNFAAHIVQVNGNTGDDDATNNTMTSTFISAPKWPAQFKIQMRTNDEADSTGNCETRWQIFDESNTVVASRNVAAINTLYTDTVTLAPGGSYKFVITDGSCDGLQWWANSGTSINAGYLIVKQVTGTNITMNGYYYGGTYNNDFGCGFTQYFTTSSTTGVNDIDIHAGLEVYPNPAQNMVDELGRVVSETSCTDIRKQINVETLANGVYTILFIDSKQPENRLTTRLLIAK